MRNNFLFFISDDIELGQISLTTNETSNLLNSINKISLNCKDLASAFEYFYSNEVKSALLKLEEVLLLKIKVDDDFKAPSHEEVKKLIIKSINKPLVVFISSISQKLATIFWTGPEAQKIYVYKPFNEVPEEADEKFQEFIAKFLAEALKGGGNGEEN